MKKKQQQTSDICTHTIYNKRNKKCQATPVNDPDEKRWLHNLKCIWSLNFCFEISACICKFQKTQLKKKKRKKKLHRKHPPFYRQNKSSKKRRHSFRGLPSVPTHYLCAFLSCKSSPRSICPKRPCTWFCSSHGTLHLSAHFWDIDIQPRLFLDST